MSAKLKVFLFCIIFSIFILLVSITMIITFKNIKDDRKGVHKDYISIELNDNVPDNYIKNMSIKIYSIEKLPEFSVSESEVYKNILLINTDNNQSVTTYFKVHFQPPYNNKVVTIKRDTYLSVIIPLNENYKDVKDIKFSYNKIDKSYKVN